ncbi:MAG TPA: hypothetical protein VK447_08190 [Myxococcaceae bacterium]|nr:hypothetical protein [Myxococcaceae bacterium]
MRARGLCQTHYNQQREHGRTWPISPVRPPREGEVVRLASGQRVTRECADVLKRVAKERGQAINQVVTDVVEAWVKRRGSRRSR